VFLSTTNEWYLGLAIQDRIITDSKALFKVNVLAEITDQGCSRWEMAVEITFNSDLYRHLDIQSKGEKFKMSHLLVI
jgi:hypothetical protein